MMNVNHEIMIHTFLTYYVNDIYFSNFNVLPITQKWDREIPLRKRWSESMIQSELDLQLRAWTSFPFKSIFSGIFLISVNWIDGRKIYYVRLNEARMCDNSAECTAGKCGNVNDIFVLSSSYFNHVYVSH